MNASLFHVGKGHVTLGPHDSGCLSNATAATCKSGSQNSDVTAISVSAAKQHGKGVLKWQWCQMKGTSSAVEGTDLK